MNLNYQLEGLSAEMLELYDAMPGPNVKREFDPGEVEAMLKALDEPGIQRSTPDHKSQGGLA